MTRRTTVVCRSVEATERCARGVAAAVGPGQVVILAGGLGAGKTTFTKAYAAALGVATTVTSPSYTLVHHYACASTSPVAVLLHADLWRLQDVVEVADLGLDEPLADGAAAIVEWGDRYEAALPGDHVVITFRVVDDETRELTIDLADSSVPDGALDLLASAP